jgi:DNA-binding NarL/FixJ family response regulator
MSNLVKHKPAQVDAFLESLRIDRDDDVKLRLKGGILSIVVKRADGRVQSATTMLGGNFQSRTAYASDEVSPAERREIVKQLRKKGHRQTTIADLLGVSQATVSLDLKK